MWNGCIDHEASGDLLAAWTAKEQLRGLLGCARLLDAAHRQLGGPLAIIEDHLNSHVSQAMTELIAAGDWLTVYRLPPYAHELNPVQPVWSHLKRSLANLAKRNLSQLTVLTRLKADAVPARRPRRLPRWHRARPHTLQ
jgi:transposase